MMKNIKEIVILALTSGILILLAVIIIGDYWVAVKENRPVDTEIITLMKMFPKAARDPNSRLRQARRRWRCR